MRRLCLLFCLLCLSPLAARADSLNFNVNGTFVGGGTLTGTLVLNTTTSSFSSASLVVSGVGAQSDGTYNSIASQGLNGEYNLTFYGTGYLLLSFPVSNLVGYTGGNLCLANSGCTNSSLVETVPGYQVTRVLSGTVVAQATPTPEPSTLLSLATALAIGCYTQRRRILA